MHKDPALAKRMGRDAREEVINNYRVFCG